MYWLLRENGDKMTTAGRTRKTAELRAASWVASLKRPITFSGPDGDTGTIMPEDVHRLDPDPVTKKTFKEKVKQGIVFRAVHCETTGVAFVTGSSAQGGRWVAKVEVNKGWVRKVIR